MATISSPGIGSGLDINSIVTQLVALERRPITLLQQQATKLEAKLSSFGLLQSYVSNLRSAASTLAQPSAWNLTTASSSDATSVSVSSSAGAVASGYAVQVSQLAQAQALASRSYTGTTDTVGTGTLRIEKGTWNEDLTSFTPAPDAALTDIVIALEDATLEGIRARINAANAGVTASIVTDASGARLVLRSEETGAEQAVRITATDDDGNPGDGSGLSALAFDPPSQSGQMVQTQAARNALLSVNGLALETGSNRLDNVVEGLTIQLHRVTSGPVELTVGADRQGLKGQIEAFVNAYNDINRFLAEQTRYDEASQTAGKLQGDSAAVGMRNQLRAMLQQGGGASVFTSLSELGIQAQRDGSLKIDSARLDNALENGAEVASFFSNPTEGAEGLAVRLRSFATALTSADGSLTARTDGLRATLERNKDQQERYETRAQLVQQRLLRQYQALDGQLGQLSGLGNYVGQQLNLLNAFYTGGRN